MLLPVNSLALNLDQFSNRADSTIPIAMIFFLNYFPLRRLIRNNFYFFYWTFQKDSAKLLNIFKEQANISIFSSDKKTAKVSFCV